MCDSCSARRGMPSTTIAQIAQTTAIDTTRTRRRQLEPEAERGAPAHERLLQVADGVVEQRPLAGAVERRRADRHQQQRPSSRTAMCRACADTTGGRRTTHPSRPPEGREPGEQAEPDAERVTPARPRLDAVQAHPHELDREVDEHEHRERLRILRLRPAQLADREREDPGGCGPVAEPLGIRQRLRQRVTRDLARDPAGRRPIARHGLNSRKTSPNSSEANGTPIQKPTYTAFGARLSDWLSTPPARRRR